jgi:hypothetical protein
VIARIGDSAHQNWVAATAIYRHLTWMNRIGGDQISGFASDLLEVVDLLI